MELLPAEGLKVLDTIGYGGNGRVFLVEDAQGRKLALKILDSRAVDTAGLVASLEKLSSGGWPEGVLPLVSAELKEEPPFLLMELTGGRAASLQDVDFNEPHPDAPAVARAVARALADMHAKGVTHANLKPGNVFLREHDVWLADWGMGNVMPDAEFTDAVLYQPPEQLEDPRYGDGAEMLRRDVYAFGALAFRLLTGRFPRCHATFSKVTPAPGETHKEGIRADLAKVAGNVRAHAEPEWGDVSPETEELRGLVTRCLALDSAARPADMMAVWAEIEGLEETEDVEEEEPAAAEENVEAPSPRELVKTEKVARRAMFAVGSLVVVALGLAGLWRLSVSQLDRTRTERDDQRKQTERLREEAALAVAEAEGRAAKLEQSARYEKELGESRLEASRIIGDRLFDWAMEKGRRSLPALEGREQRLKQLERYYQDLLIRIKDDARLAEENRRVKLQLAEVSIAAGDSAAAESRLSDAMAAWGETPLDDGMRTRLATDSLLLALLRYSRGEPEAEAAFQSARGKLTALRGDGVDTMRRDQLLAILDYHDAKLLAAKGDDAKALEQLMHATQSLRKLAGERPDAAILRSELAACHLSSASILEGMGNLGDAREVRLLASAELVKLIEKNPKDVSLRLDLAACYGAIAEAALLSGDVASADSMCQSAMKLVDGILIEQPDNTQATAIKAAQLGLRGGMRRDRGATADAMKDIDEGIRLLEAMRATAPGDTLVAYRLALLYWQKGRMIGIAGNRAEEEHLLKSGRAILAKIEGGKNENGPRDEQLRLSSAYLLGDLGHSLHLAGKLDDARKTFNEAIAVWESLNAARAHSEEYSEGLQWCRQRVADLGGKK